MRIVKRWRHEKESNSYNANCAPNYIIVSYPYAIEGWRHSKVSSYFVQRI